MILFISKKNVLKSFFYIIVSVFLFIFSTPFVSYANAGITATGDGSGITITGADFPQMTGDVDIVDLATEPLNKYKGIATVVTGFATVTAFLGMIFSMSKLATAGDNEQARKKAIMGILTSGIGVALLGSATVIIGFFWNFLKT